MSFLDSLEQRFGRFAMTGLIRVVVGFQAAVFVLFLFDPHYVDLLTLNRVLVLNGEVWRLISFVFIPPQMGLLGPVGVAMTLMFLWMIGNGLEETWGAFRLNVFYFIGLAATILTSMVIGFGTSAFLHLSLLFAFATLYPTFPISLYFIITIPIKWLAWVSFGFLGYTFLVSGFKFQLLIIASFANYLLFFGPQLIAQIRQRTQVAERRREFVEKQRPTEDALYVCKVCGRTEQTNPELEFRVARDGEEYCREHLPKAAAATPSAS